MKIKEYIKTWNDWRKDYKGSIIYKFLVLIKLANSPSFEFFKCNRLMAITCTEAIKNFSNNVGKLGCNLNEFVNYYKESINNDGNIQK